MRLDSCAGRCNGFASFQVVSWDGVQPGSEVAIFHQIMIVKRECRMKSHTSVRRPGTVSYVASQTNRDSAGG